MSDPNFDPVAMAMAQNALLESVMQRLDEVTRYVDQVWRQAQPSAQTVEMQLRHQCLSAAIQLYQRPDLKAPEPRAITDLAAAFLGFMRGEAGAKATVLSLLPGGKS